MREVTKRAEGKEGAYILQLCEWHGVGAIKQHLISAGRYPTDLRDEIINLIWKWVKSSALAQLEENYFALLNKLLAPEQDYLLAHYKAKEHQFFRAYTRSYLNLGVNSRQCSETYHPVIKSLVNRQFSLPKAVRRIKDHLQDIGAKYDPKLIVKESSNLYSLGSLRFLSRNHCSLTTVLISTLKSLLI